MTYIVCYYYVCNGGCLKLYANFSSLKGMISFLSDMATDLHFGLDYVFVYNALLDDSISFTK